MGGRREERSGEESWGESGTIVEKIGTGGRINKKSNGKGAKGREELNRNLKAESVGEVTESAPEGSLYFRVL